MARRLLDDELSNLTELAIARVNADEPEYAQSLVSQADLRQWMARTLALALARVAGDDIPQELETAASEVGRLRAMQGLSLPALLHSYRIDLRILWEAIMREATAAGVVPDEALFESSILVWEAIEANTAEVVDAYRQAREEMSKSLDVIKERTFAKLVEGGETDTTTVRDAAKRLSLPPDARYLVVVADDVPVDHATVVGLVTRLSGRGLSSYFAWIGDEFVGVVLLAGRRPEELAPHLVNLGEWKCGGAAVDGLAGIPRGVRLARAVIAGLTDPGVHLLESDWPSALVNSSEEIARSLADHVLGPLFALPENDRAAVFETLEAFVEGSGSVAEVASQTLRHRNTVRNRLQTVERLTNLSLSRPRDVASLALAMAWRRGPAGRKYWA